MQERCRSYEKYKAINEPRCHCKSCWFLYFTLHKGLVAAIKTALDTLKDGKKQVIRGRGKKFVKIFEVFKKEMLTK